MDYHELLREPAARLVGARPHEVVAMNSLTVNLHLLMASFYRPAGRRTRIVIEDTAFPSDSYAVASQAVHHGLDPDATVVRLRPRDGEDNLRTEDVLARLEREGDTIALVLLGGVNYLTGQLMDMAAITKAGRAAGAVVGWDLAHAAGNVPSGCTTGTPTSPRGAPTSTSTAGRARSPDASSTSGTSGTPRCRSCRAGGAPTRRCGSGWTPASRRRRPPTPGSCPTRRSWRWRPSWRPWRSSTGSGWRRCAEERAPHRLPGVPAARGRPETITPADPAARGAQLSLRVADAGGLVRALADRHGVIADAREPDIVRLAPALLYCTFHDCHRAAAALADLA
ncbi:kynureninase/PvdN C-terminal domain-containing protein [Actinomadura madurae]|uniref:kynureninase/PvdN C-terminal domain-containing protein n=1 Tax=Actinomadura madurae TaxID=1993 RepID=UPI0020D24D4D|nr:kynureninase [Actinomadura madurae]MCP9985190.1 kynureninase [Actinomadura madurae]